MEQREVEEVSFLPVSGEAILNKKAVYEPSKGQRCRQIVCSRPIAVCILIGMGSAMIAIALIAAFARPALMNTPACSNTSASLSLSSSQSSSSNTNTPTPSFISTSGEKFPWENLRLPRSTIPLSYDIFLHPNISKSFFDGQVVMTLKVAKKTDFIVFHSHKLTIKDISIKYSGTRSNRAEKEMEQSCDSLRRKFSSEINSDGGNDNDKESESTSKRSGSADVMNIKKRLEYTLGQQYYVELDHNMDVGSIVKMTVTFTGSLADLANMEGFYKSEFTVNGEKRSMLSTQFEASHARRSFPCMDEPDLKATFKLSVVRDADHISLFNTKLISSKPYQGKKDLVLDVYESTVCMSTYLVAYVVTSQFKSVETKTKDDLLIRVFAPKDKIYMGQFALNAAVTIIEKYNEFFGIPYPLDKLDLIAIPNFSAGAMENWGLVTYRDTLLLYDPDRSTISTKKHVALVVAHELAHQWFGNLVTMKWWNNLWLNEGFASYVENIGANEVDQNFHVFETMVCDARVTFKLDGVSSSHPIEIKISDPSDVEAAFNTITYNKGAHLIHMLRGAIGRDEFHKGLNYYLKSHAYNNAETKDLWKAFQKYSNLDKLTVSDFMDTWTQQMGYPVVTVTRDHKRIYLQQERFLINKEDEQKNSHEYSWHIPFKYKLSVDHDTVLTVWLNRGNASIELPQSEISWLKGNADSEGYFRVNYDKEGWDALSDQLEKDHTVFSNLDRVSLLDDAFELAKSGRLTYDVPFKLCMYLKKETDFFVWQSITGNLLYLQDRLYLHESYDDLKDLIMYIGKPLFDSVGWENNGTFTQRLLRRQILALATAIDYEPAINTAIEWFEKWKKDKDVKLNNDLTHTILKVGVRHGKKSDWDLVYERYLNEIVPSKKNTLMMVLTSSRDPRVLQILLERSLDTSVIKSQSTISILSGIAFNSVGKLYTWRFLQEKWDVFFQRYGSSSFGLSSLIKSTVGQFSTQFDLDEVMTFFKDKDLGSAKMTYSQVLDMIRSHINWEKSYLTNVSAWLRGFASINH